MIEDGITQVILAIARVLLLALPSYTLPEGISLSILAAADFILPLSELLLVFAAGAAFATASLVYTLAMRLLRLLVGR